MPDNTSELQSGDRRAYCLAVGGYALALPGALLLGLAVFLYGFESGWGRDSIGAGIVMGIFAPGIFLGAVFVLTLLAACAVWPHGKSSCVRLLGTTIGFAVVSLLVYFSSFISMVRDATESARAWQGHSLPGWWDEMSLAAALLSIVFIIASLGLLVASLRSTRKNARQQMIHDR